MTRTETNEMLGKRQSAFLAHICEEFSLSAALVMSVDDPNACAGARFRCGHYGERAAMAALLVAAARESPDFAMSLHLASGWLQLPRSTKRTFWQRLFGREGKP